ncbi:hypothetical protein OO006_08775 [Prosthecochloris sp. SCSIO W1101]|uniref:hypothetical protein n=1 Tax=Prosthecochloris sp. SCSIO W1101 TaxID=2992242 RepID=UPI00223D3EFB|nr:hypothetical protein [Prosthecochloris sp. SCSIO W1101]UZJ40454.1 hypothetical protein OO006_08775 [Prosthecochloris sp. SCSIO W1101]
MSGLTVEELQKEHTAKTLLPWAYDWVNRLPVTMIRLRQGLAKPLIEEALPLGIFAMHHFNSSEDVTLSLVLGNQNYDALVKDERKNPSPFNYIEVTQAHEGEGQYLRMLELEKKGFVSAHGAMHKTGSKAKGINVDAVGIAVSPEVILYQELDRIEAAVKRKIGKKYPEATALVIVFDDYSLQRYEENKKKNIEKLERRLNLLLPSLEGFVWFSAVGWSRKTFVEYDLTCK